MSAGDSGLADLRKISTSQGLAFGGTIEIKLVKTRGGWRVKLSVSGKGENCPAVVVFEDYELIQLATELLMFQQAAQWKGFL